MLFIDTENKKKVENLNKETLEADRPKVWIASHSNLIV